MNYNFETEKLATFLSRETPRDLEIVKLFVYNGADLEHNSILVNVCRNNHTRILLYIIENHPKKDDINFLNKFSFNSSLFESDKIPILEAFDNGHFVIVKTLINLGVNISINNNILAKKSMLQNFDILVLLHEKGLDLTFEDNYLLFHLVQNSAFETQMLPILDFLIKNGADLNGRNNEILCNVSSIILLNYLVENYYNKFSEKSIENTFNKYFSRGYNLKFLHKIIGLIDKTNNEYLKYRTTNRLSKYFKIFLNNYGFFNMPLNASEVLEVLDYYLNNTDALKILNSNYSYFIPDFALNRILNSLKLTYNNGIFPAKSLYRTYLNDITLKDSSLESFHEAFKFKGRT